MKTRSWGKGVGAGRQLQSRPTGDVPARNAVNKPAPWGRGEGRWQQLCPPPPLSSCGGGGGLRFTKPEACQLPAKRAQNLHGAPCSPLGQATCAGAGGGGAEGPLRGGVSKGLRSDPPWGQGSGRLKAGPSVHGPQPPAFSWRATCPPVAPLWTRPMPLEAVSPAPARTSRLRRPVSPARLPRCPEPRAAHCHPAGWSRPSAQDAVPAARGQGGLHLRLCGFALAHDGGAARHRLPST